MESAAERHFDPRLRSLVQKCARRGAVNILRQVVERLVDDGDGGWLRARTAVIVFEECWPLATLLARPRMATDFGNVLVEVCSSKKQKDAAGLGALGYALFEGDSTSTEAVPDVRAVRIVSEAMSRPNAFFDWAEKHCQDRDGLLIVTSAKSYFPAATWGWDKATLISAAYLATVEPISQPILTRIDEEEKFPYWVAVDKHTPQGKNAIKRVSASERVSYQQLLWASFYYESAKCNALDDSPWWHAERSWRLKKVGISESAAEQMWKQIGPKVAHALEAEANGLRNVVENGRSPQNRIF